MHVFIILGDYPSQIFGAPLPDNYKISLALFLLEMSDAGCLLDLLTPREFEVMQLIITEMLNKQVGGELGVAEKTIKVHRGRVMQKLGIVSVAELVRLVQKAGLTDSAASKTKVL